MWQKRILLTFVKTVNFIDKQDGATPGIAVLPRALDGFADLFTPDVTAEMRSTSAWP